MDFLCDFIRFFRDFIVAKRFMLRYYVERFTVVGHMAELVDALVSGTSGSNTLEVRVFLCPPYRSGVVAQLIERYVRIVEVVGLSPISSTKFSRAGRAF